MRKSDCNSLLLFLVFTLAFSPLVFAQSRVVSGVVLEQKNGQPLEGATITLKGGTTSTLADAGGRFKISIPTGNDLYRTGGLFHGLPLVANDHHIV